MTKVDVKELVRGIVGLIIIVGLIVCMVIGVKQCSTLEDQRQQQLSRFTYEAHYGNFIDGYTNYLFDHYTLQNGCFTLYDTDNSVVGVVYSNSRNQMTVTRRHQ